MSYYILLKAAVACHQSVRNVLFLDSNLKQANCSILNFKSLFVIWYYIFSYIFSYFLLCLYVLFFLCENVWLKAEIFVGYIYLFCSCLNAVKHLVDMN